MSEKTVHHGHNIKRIREIQRIKQETLAVELGEDWNQKKVSLLEGKEVVDDALLNEVAKALNVTPEAINNFDEEKAVYNIQNNYEGSHNQGSNVGYQCNFNPLDKYVEQIEENKRLYEALLKSEREKNALLERMLKAKE